IALTDAGRYFLDQTEKMTQRLQETVNATRRIGKNDRIWFGVGFVPSTLYGHMPALIRQLRQLNTQVEIGLVEMTTLQQFEALKSGRIDIGVGRILLKDDEIERLVLTDEPLVVALPITHRLADNASVRLADIMDEPLILYPTKPRPSYADHVLNLFRQKGYSPQVIQEVNELQTAIGLVTATIGIAIVPESVRRLHRDDVVYVNLDEPGFTSPIMLSWRKNDHSAFLKQTIGLFKRTAI
uniref:LysR substrate-binding domain-containing protein n=1 Tax=Advenella sp. FME57 TaxID=2742604 RepID=UPI0018678668